MNRAPVLTLWATVVAQRLGFNRDEALTMGRVVAGLNAGAKDTVPGLYHSRPRTGPIARRALPLGTVIHVELLDRSVPMMRTVEGLRALIKEKAVAPDSVQQYLESKFGDMLAWTEAVMMRLARSIPEAELPERAYPLYEAFRPEIPTGVASWGASGILDLERIRDLGKHTAGGAG